MSQKVKYTSSEHLITRQANAEKEFLAQFEENKHTLNNPFVVKNPYLINPLCALIMFHTPRATAPTVTVCGKRFERENLAHTFAADTFHKLPVLGLYEDFANRVIISLPDGTEKEIVIQTEKLPDDVCRCLNVMTSADYLQDNFMFLTPAGKNLPTAYDYKGDIRWILTENTMFDIKRAANGNILTGSSRFCRMPYNSTGLVELDMLGKVYKEYRLPATITTTISRWRTATCWCSRRIFTGKPLRTCVFSSTAIPEKFSSSGTTPPFFPRMWPAPVPRTPTTGFTTIRSGTTRRPTADLFRTPPGRHCQHRFDSGKLNWIIGDPEGWPEEMVKKYFFTPVGDVKNFDWQYEQHAALVCPNGDVMCFDNGQYRAKQKENYIKNCDNFSSGCPIPHRYGKNGNRTGVAVRQGTGAGIFLALYLQCGVL
jgi:arylsulfate sulfotransferase